MARKIIATIVAADLHAGQAFRVHGSGIGARVASKVTRKGNTVSVQSTTYKGEKADTFTLKADQVVGLTRDGLVRAIRDGKAPKAPAKAQASNVDALIAAAVAEALAAAGVKAPKVAPKARKARKSTLTPYQAWMKENLRDFGGNMAECAAAYRAQA